MGSNQFAWNEDDTNTMRLIRRNTAQRPVPQGVLRSDAASLGPQYQWQADYRCYE